MNKFQKFYYVHTNTISSIATAVVCLGLVVAACAIVVSTTPDYEEED